jgi:hypothetical protein
LAYCRYYKIKPQLPVSEIKANITPKTKKPNKNNKLKLIYPIKRFPCISICKLPRHFTSKTGEKSVKTIDTRQKQP